MLTCHVHYLNKFDFHISLLTNGQPIDLDNILNSFKPFIGLYEKWDMWCISRWKFMPYIPYLLSFPFERIHLWTLNYNHVITRREYDMPTIIISHTFDIRSTNRFNLNNYHQHFSGKKKTFFTAKKTITTTTASTIPCENVNYIVCHLAYPNPAIISYLENRMKDDDNAKKYLDNLSRLVKLSNINALKFSRNNGITRLHVIEHVLLACPNVTELIIGSSLFFSPQRIKQSDTDSYF
ncbi:unnamed protein product [Rotaria socialis]|uniref:Uncharacterized protein n=1 Tax=Rotaria socialis TaxID=392032 RepID=A0A820MPR8_9BILA|nr:unnamed protein product [Rotaria socialis]CAF4557473.1 unnamed protein product [Rotaria socialis]